MLRDEAQRAPLAVAADPEGDVTLRRFRLAQGLAQLEEAAVEVARGLLEERADDLDALFEHVEPAADPLEGDAVGEVLALIPAGAEAGFEAAVGELVDRGQCVGQHGRMAVVHRQHHRADPHVLRVAGERSEAGETFEIGAALLGHRRLIEVVRDVEPVEAGGVGPAPELAALGERDVLLDQVNAKSHVPPPQRRLSLAILAPA